MSRSLLAPFLLALGLAIAGPAGTAQAAPSPSASVTATHAAAPAAVTAPTVLYAVNRSAGTVVKFSGTATGRFTAAVVGRGLRNVRALAVDAAGNAYVINDGSLVRISTAGVQRTVAANLTGLMTLTVDGHGTVFVTDARRVIRIFQPSGAQTVLGSIFGTENIEGLGVDGVGRPTVSYSDGNFGLVLATFPAAGGTPSTRTISGVTDEGSNTYPLVESPNGTVFVGVREVGGSGAHYVERIDPGSTTAKDQQTRLSDYAWTVDPQTRLHLMQIRKWCFDPAIGDGSCTENLSVDRILVFPAPGGSPRNVLTSNLTLPPGGIAVAADQTTYAAAGSALVRIPAAGGPAQPLIPGAFDLLTVTPGS